MPSQTPANPVPPEREKLDETYHRLRGAIHSLGLCVKVLETRDNLAQLTEYAVLIEKTATEIEQLLLNLQAETH